MPRKPSRLFVLRKMDDGVYDVLVSGTRLATVRRDENAWSHEPWCIDGDFRQSSGGVNGTQSRRAGFRRLHDAAREAAIMNSAALLASVPDAPDDSPAEFRP